MQSSRLVVRSLRGAASRSSPITSRFLSSSFPRPADHKDRVHSNAEGHRDAQTSKPDVPHMTNTTSTISNEMPSVGADKPPPDMITSVDPEFTPKDSVPENVERMTGETQKGAPESGANADLGVGEMEGAKFKVEPLRREGEDPSTMRARLLCPSLIQKAEQSFIRPYIVSYITIANIFLCRPKQEKGNPRI
jgi:hypothetical protein